LSAARQRQYAHDISGMDQRAPASAYSSLSSNSSFPVHSTATQAAWDAHEHSRIVNFLMHVLFRLTAKISEEQRRKQDQLEMQMSQAWAALVHTVSLPSYSFCTHQICSEQAHSIIRHAPNGVVAETYGRAKERRFGKGQIEPLGYDSLAAPNSSKSSCFAALSVRAGAAASAAAAANHTNPSVFFSIIVHRNEPRSTFTATRECIWTVSSKSFQLVQLFWEEFGPGCSAYIAT
jgi:hypothetical protein